MERRVHSHTHCCQEHHLHGPPGWFRDPFGQGTVRLTLVCIAAYVTLLIVVELALRDDLPWSQHITYFAACAVLCVPICFSHGVLTASLAGLRPLKRTSAWLAAGTLWCGLPATAVMYGVDRWFRPELSGYRLRDLGPVVVVAMLLSGSLTHFTSVRRMKHTAEREPDAMHGRPETAGQSADPRPPAQDAPVPDAGRHFLDRLPADVGEDLIYLRMKDHYVKAVTTAGQCGILMRFGDAVSELETLGIRVHRSYWVHYDHVDGLVQRGQRRFLRLTDDREIPVSRSYQAATEEALARRVAEGSNTEGSNG